MMIKKKKERKINEQICGPQTCNINNQSFRGECLEILDISDGAEQNQIK